MRSSNVATGSTTTTLVLDASTSAVDDAYNNLIVEIIDGKGINQSREITDYTGGRLPAQLDPHGVSFRTPHQPM